MKYVATLNGKKYEIEIERVDGYRPLDRGAAAVAPAPIIAQAAAPAPAVCSRRAPHNFLKRSTEFACALITHAPADLTDGGFRSFQFPCRRPDPVFLHIGPYRLSVHLFKDVF